MQPEKLSANALNEIVNIADTALNRSSDEEALSNDQPWRPYDYVRVARLIAAVEAAQFFQEHFPLAENRFKKEPLLRYACSLADHEGDVLEFGVGKGRTLRILCELFPDQPVYAFDSFEGLPTDWTHDRRQGRYETGGRPPDNLPDNAEVFVGMFADQLPRYLQRSSAEVRLIHLDCDLYESAREVLFGLAPRLVPGSVIVFDEYLNYPGWKQHEYKAFTEFTETFGKSFEYVGFASSYLSVAVRITG